MDEDYGDNEYGIVPRDEIETLLWIAHSTNAPDVLPEFATTPLTTVTFWVKDGWRVVIDYGYGRIGQIQHFIRPDGTEIHFWDWIDPDYDTGRQYLLEWRGLDTTEEVVERWLHRLAQFRREGI